ncbi:hypothetical protein [Pseudochryseolinea flava]|uniref:Uncharacterized protein n=1 Tax=Pseudochryseolinea flava TaxID=2059302 RepID=A0A364Y7Z1_9BACT|nr:hypothetical protein [Pseudochryseolinea flava]RAW02254.1 hypothetical protein DQQ10_06855 [Pseudochryseolinea flava]
MTSVIAMVALFAYVSTIAFEILHHVDHDHTENAFHAQALENDPCHRALVHHDRASGCAHKAHIVAPEKCKCHHIVVQFPQVCTGSEALKTTAFVSPPATAGYAFGFTNSFFLTARFRGPPSR